jgi:hypothetical protein
MISPTPATDVIAPINWRWGTLQFIELVIENRDVRSSTSGQDQAGNREYRPAAPVFPVRVTPYSYCLIRMVPTIHSCDGSMLYGVLTIDVHKVKWLMFSYAFSRQSYDISGSPDS